MSKQNFDRARNWCFTAYEDPKLWFNDHKKELVKYLCYQPEMCPTTNRQHYQGYVEFHKDYTFTCLKKKFFENGTHFEPRKGTQTQAIAYCMKSESKNGEFFEFGKPKQQGKRSDLDEMIEDIHEDYTMVEILRKHQGNALRIIHCLEKAMVVHHGLFCLDDYILAKRKFLSMTTEDCIDTRARALEDMGTIYEKCRKKYQS